MNIIPNYQHIHVYTSVHGLYWYIIKYRRFYSDCPIIFIKIIPREKLTFISFFIIESKNVFIPYDWKSFLPSKRVDYINMWQTNLTISWVMISISFSQKSKKWTRTDIRSITNIRRLHYVGNHNCTKQ